MKVDGVHGDGLESRGELGERPGDIPGRQDEAPGLHQMELLAGIREFTGCFRIGRQVRFNRRNEGLAQAADVVELNRVDAGQALGEGFLGKNVTHIGGHGAGQVAKAANQIIVGLTIEAVAEALVFASKAGVDPEKVRKALLGGYAQSRVLELHGRRMTDRNFEPGGKVRSHKKDIEIVMSVARELGMCLPGTALLSHLWNAVAGQGGLDWDHSSLVKVLEVMSQTEVKGE